MCLSTVYKNEKEEANVIMRNVMRIDCTDTTVTLTDQWFPTKDYGSFALPAGQYRALKVVIGEGKGQNWWCVVVPPLCMASVTEEVTAAAVQAGLSGEQAALITGQDGGYVLKFKVIEWWEEICRKLGVMRDAC